MSLAGRLNVKIASIAAKPKVQRSIRLADRVPNPNAFACLFTSSAVFIANHYVLVDVYISPINLIDSFD